MEGNHHGMVQPQLLGRSQVEVGPEPVAQKSSGHGNVTTNRVLRHGTPDFLGSVGLLRQPYAKGRDVVVEEVNEMVRVYIDYDIRGGLFHILPHLFHQSFGSQFSRPGIRDLPYQPRRMRHPGGEN